MRLGGIDPALANFGLAKVDYDMNTGKIVPVSLKLSHTEKRTGKQVRQNSDDLRRAWEHCVNLQKWLQDCTVAFAEIPTGSQSARGAFSNGVSLGILAGVALNNRLIQLLPHEVKSAVTGSKVASKEEMIEWGVENYPTLPWLKHRGKTTAANEHLADALATIVAGTKTEEFKNMLTMWKLMANTQVKS
jgi:Holliday junction resolvasome RuvABC endonuclease subunit